MPGSSPVHPTARIAHRNSPAQRVFSAPRYPQFPALLPRPLPAILHLDEFPVVLWHSALGSGLTPSKASSHSPHSHSVHTTISVHITLHGIRVALAVVHFGNSPASFSKYKVPEGKEYGA